VLLYHIGGLTILHSLTYRTWCNAPGRRSALGRTIRLTLDSARSLPDQADMAATLTPCPKCFCLAGHHGLWLSGSSCGKTQNNWKIESARIKFPFQLPGFIDGRGLPSVFSISIIPVFRSTWIEETSPTRLGEFKVNRKSTFPWSCFSCD